MVQRLLLSVLRNTKKSVLLLGPRQTGKSTLIHELKPDVKINLAHEPTYFELVRDPYEFERRIGQKAKTVFIDEIQRIPALLNTIQVWIDRGGVKFYLTGSSARKLKRGQANLLPGRIHVHGLGPLSVVELKEKWDSGLVLAFGSLPGIYLDPDTKQRQKTLEGYSLTYLKEEIQAEALTRDLGGFSRFVQVVAASATRYLDMKKLSSDSQVTRKSAIRFFEILEDTLIIHRLQAFSRSQRRRLIQHPRFFLFDNGVLNALLENFTVSADRKGFLLENAFFSQLQALKFALSADFRISNYRTEHGAEVDFIIETKAGNLWGIELKASKELRPQSFPGLESFSNFVGKKCRLLVGYLGTKRYLGKIEIRPWSDIIEEIYHEFK